MSTTTRIPTDRLAKYFSTFTRRFLNDDSPEFVDVQIMEPDLGDQRMAEGVRLVGVTYDEQARTLEVALEPGDHRVYEPKEVWAVEEDDGFVSAIEVVRGDSTKEIISVKRANL